MTGSRLTSAIVCILTLLLLGSAMAGEKFNIQIAPFLGRHAGKASYEFNIKQRGPDTQQIQQVYTVRSKLEFPADASLVGLNFRLRPQADVHRWSIGADIATNLNNPNGLMTDSDWEAITNYFPITQFSYTESSVEMSMVKAGVDFSLRLFKVGTADISLMGGAKLQHINEDVIGYDGWYRPFDSTTFRFLDAKVVQSATGKVMTYRLTTFQPYGGVRVDLNLSPALETQADAGLGPVFFSDRDDHLLRYKLSTASGNGLGVTGSFRSDYRLTQGTGINYVLGFSGNVQYASLSGTQTQTWYNNEVVVGPVPGDTTIIAPAGTTFTGLPHDLKYTLWEFGLFFGLRF